MSNATTKNVAHTPGPWILFHRNKTIQVGTNPEPGETLCAVVHWAGFDSTDKPLAEQLANATLIAAAPELLSMLEALEQAYSNKHSPQHRAACLANARGVIDMARGA